VIKCIGRRGIVFGRKEGLVRWSEATIVLSSVLSRGILMAHADSAGRTWWVERAGADLQAQVVGKGDADLFHHAYSMFPLLEQICLSFFGSRH
jgi:hypothetical protein